MPGQIDLNAAAAINPLEVENSAGAKDLPPSIYPTEEVSSPNVKILPPLPRAGYKLANFILYIISGYIVFLALMFIFSGFDASDKMEAFSKTPTADSLFGKKMELLKAIQDEKKGYRDFIMQVSQMILLNLLLPTLTAILGYIFGTREESRRPSE